MIEQRQSIEAASDDVAGPRRGAALRWYARRLSWPILSGLVSLADFVGVIAAGVAAFFGYVVIFLNGWSQADRYGAVIILGASFAGVMWQIAGINDPRHLARRHFRTGSVCFIWIAALLLTGATGFLLKSTAEFSRGWVIIWIALSVGILIANRIVLARVAGACRRHGLLARRLLLITDEANLMRARNALETDSVRGALQVTQTVLMRDSSIEALANAVRDAMDAARRNPVDIVLVAARASDSRRLAGAVDPLRDLPADLWMTLSEGAEELRRIGVREVGPVVVLELDVSPLKDWAALLKAVEDRLIAAVLLVLVAPFIMMAAIAIRLETRGPVLFRQQRFGFNGHPINVLKLRTMYVEKADPSGERSTAPQDQRVTRVGRFLRRASIDELPQLWNVIEGSMSMVGPRAHPVRMRVTDQYYHEMFTHYAARHQVKPGITGLAQVHGNRGQVDSEAKARERLYYDLAYIREWSLWLDLKIIAKTPIALLRGDNAY